MWQDKDVKGFLLLSMVKGDVNLLFDPLSGTEGGGTVPINWMPTAV